MPKRGHLDQVVIVVLMLAAGWGVVAGVRSRSPETDLAAPGSALYEYAVTESVKSLMSKQEQAELGAASRPPSPGPDYFWCENCKTYHQKQAVPNQPGAAVQASPGTPAPRGVPAAGSGVDTRPPSPGEGYYWCANCKSYHLRQTPAQQPGASPAAAPADGIGAAQVPDGKNYYYCENCKTYHRRKPVLQQSVEDLILGEAER